MHRLNALAARRAHISEPIRRSSHYRTTEGLDTWADAEYTSIYAYCDSCLRSVGRRRK